MPIDYEFDSFTNIKAVDLGSYILQAQLGTRVSVTITRPLRDGLGGGGITVSGQGVTSSKWFVLIDPGLPKPALTDLIGTLAQIKVSCGFLPEDAGRFPYVAVVGASGFFREEVKRAFKGYDADHLKFFGVSQIPDLRMALR
ncbi:MAG: hypothetical protein U0670_06735 [Anaerolineae bacterium]